MIKLILQSYKFVDFSARIDCTCTCRCSGQGYYAMGYADGYGGSAYYKIPVK